MTQSANLMTLRNGTNLSAVGLGTGMLCSANSGVDRLHAVSVLRAAASAGMNVFDTANIYGQGDAERAMGAAFGPERRDDVFIATKVGYAMPAGATAARWVKPVLRGAARFGKVRRAISGVRGRSQPRLSGSTALTDSLQHSLQRLGTDCVDLLMLHNPPLRTPASASIPTGA